MVTDNINNAKNVNLVIENSGNKENISPNSNAESVIFSDGESLQFKYNNSKLGDAVKKIDAAAKVEMIKDKKDTTSYAVKVKTSTGNTNETTIIPVVTDISNPHLTRKEASDIVFDVFGAKSFSNF